jgi:C1A family cysteine protease
MSEGNWSYTDQTTTCWLGGVFANGTTAPFIQKPVGTLIPIDTGTLATAKFTQTGTALGTAVQTALSQNHPVVIGIEVYESFESDAVAASGIVPMPSSKDTLLGGHALMLVGFNTNMSYTLNGKTTTGSFFIFRNSWGSGWGASGYGYLPAAYLESSSLTSEVYLVTAS